MLHRIWQRTGKHPTEILDIPSDEVSRSGLRAFIFASEIVAIETEEKAKPYPVMMCKPQEQLSEE